MRKQLDNRIPILINNNVKKNHRSFIVLVGDKGRDQVCLEFGRQMNRLAHLLLVDCKSSLLIITSTGICSSFCIMVLQERLGVY